MKTPLILILTLLFLLPSELLAEENQSSGKRGIGFHAGSTTGVGLSFRYWPESIGFQATFLPIVTEDYRFISFGVAGLYTLHQHDNLSLIGYTGFRLHREFQHNNSGWQSNPNIDQITFGFGLGPGFKYEYSQVLTANFMIGYGLYIEDDRLLGEETSFRLNITGEAGIFYKF